VIYFHKIFLFVAIALITASFSIATEPTPAPYHEYIVSGMLERLNKPKENFVVSLVGKFNQRYSDDSLVDLNGGYLGPLNWKVVTDSTGNFSLDIKYFNKVDSIGIKISSPDHSPYISPLFHTGTPSITITEQYQNPQPNGCRSCTMSTDAQTNVRIVGYKYYFSQKIVSLPY
jgi:hypothetical protein